MGWMECFSASRGAAHWLGVAIAVTGLFITTAPRWGWAESAGEIDDRIARGEALFVAGDFEGALAEFERVEAMLEGHPDQHLISYNIGRCHERLHNYGLAVAAYRRYLARAGPDAEDRADVQRRITSLLGLLATVRIVTDIGGYEVWVDDRSYGVDQTVIMVPAGIHVVEIRAPGRVADRRQIEAPAGTEQTLTFELLALPEEYAGLHRGYFWSSAALAVAVVVAAGVIGGVAMSRHDELETRLADPIQGWTVTNDEISGVQDLALTADILYGVSALFALAAVVLAFFTDWGGEAASSSSRVRVAPVGSGLALVGGFR